MRFRGAARLSRLARRPQIAHLLPERLLQQAVSAGAAGVSKPVLPVSAKAAAARGPVSLRLVSE